VPFGACAAVRLWRLTTELSGLPGLDCRAWLHHIRGGQVRPAAAGGRSNELLDVNSALALLGLGKAPRELIIRPPQDVISEQSVAW